MNHTGSKLTGHKLLYTVSCFISIGVWLFGYDQGVMSGLITNPYFKKYFNQPTSVEIGNMVAILEIGAFITSLLAAPLADAYGRRFTVRLGAIIFSIGGAVQTLTGGYRSMCVGRIISGFGVGMLSMIVPIYQSEISPANHRGKLACIEFTGNIIGYASSIWIDYACSFMTSDLSWRVPLGIQCIGGAVLALGTWVTPESPRYLIDKDLDDEGLRVIADFGSGGNMDDPLARAEFTEIKEAILADRAVGDRSYKALFKRYRGRVFIAMSSQAFAQMNGINIVSYYAPLVFEQAGFVGRDAILMTGWNSLFYMASSIVPWYIVDTLGRRPILLAGAAGMAVALTAIGWFIKVDQSFTPMAVAVGVVIYNMIFGMSWGPIPWLFPPEIMPLPFRAKGVSLSTATNWLFNYYVGVTTPLYQDLIGWRLYPMHAGFCLISLITVYFVYPETAGVPLEEMDALFGDESMEDDEDGDDKDGEDDDDEGSSFTGSGTPGSSMRSASPSSLRRKNSSTPLVGNGGPVSMMKRMFNNMRRKETGGGYDQLDQ